MHWEGVKWGGGLHIGIHWEPLNDIKCNINNFFGFDLHMVLLDAFEKKNAFISLFAFIIIPFTQPQWHQTPILIAMFKTTNSLINPYFEIHILKEGEKKHHNSVVDERNSWTNISCSLLHIWIIKGLLVILFHAFYKMLCTLFCFCFLGRRN